MRARHVVAIGGSDAGISAALRARELDPTTEFTVVVADAYPNFSGPDRRCRRAQCLAAVVSGAQPLAHHPF